MVISGYDTTVTVEEKSIVFRRRTRKPYHFRPTNTYVAWTVAYTFPRHEEMCLLWSLLNRKFGIDPPPKLLDPDFYDSSLWFNLATILYPKLGEIPALWEAAWIPVLGHPRYTRAWLNILGDSFYDFFQEPTNRYKFDLNAMVYTLLFKKNIGPSVDYSYLFSQPPNQRGCTGNDLYLLTKWDYILQRVNEASPCSIGQLVPTTYRIIEDTVKLQLQSNYRTPS